MPSTDQPARWGPKVDTTKYEGAAWFAAVVRRWWLWYLFWVLFVAADIWWMVGRG